ncbi:cold-shock protein [Paenibacillus sacheonensis]|uniref:Cold-shock protein n=1 Tax=Paenibacillus sacheonensis TaxID=742054 RepID=A0A7X4YR45_9BACL|nr:cold-shock protein [Paenibacillus sacheonensis]NBC71007.1 hypothetical protein [Paenibacillus sacheonensis]
MYFSRKRPIEDYPVEMTAIWSCTKEGCNGWLRDSFSFEDVPTCMQCKSPMQKGMKELPILHESTQSRNTAVKNMKAKSNPPESESE